MAAVGNNYLMDVQFNVVATGLMLCTIAGAMTGRWWVAAAAVGLAVAMKGYPISLALVLCVLSSRQFAWRYLIAQTAWFALPFVTQDPGYVVRQYRDWVDYGLNARFLNGWFKDAMYLAEQLGIAMTRSDYYRVEVAAAAVVGLGCLAHHIRRGGGGSWNACYALCVGWMLAFGPASEQVAYIQAAPVVAGVAFAAWLWPNPLWFRALASAAFTLLAATQFELLFPGPHQFQLGGAHPAAMLIAMVAVALHGFGVNPQATPQRLAPEPENAELRLAA